MSVNDQVTQGQPGPTVYHGGTVRSTVVPLAHPFTHDGVEYRELTVRRLRGFEAKNWAEACVLAARHGEVEPLFPGAEISAEALAFVDDDDVYAIDQVIEDFMPARFRALSALAANLQGELGADRSLTGDQ